MGRRDERHREVARHLQFVFQCGVQFFVRFPGHIAPQFTPLDFSPRARGEKSKGVN
jgi:hypothetical protein